MRIDVEMCLKMVLFVSEITPKILHLLEEFHQMFRLSLFKISKIILYFFKSWLADYIISYSVS